MWQEKGARYWKKKTTVHVLEAPTAQGIPGAIAATPHRRSLAYGPRSPRGTGYEEGRAPAAVPSTRV